MKIVTYNNIKGIALDEDIIGKPVVVNGVPIGVITGLSGGEDFEDSVGNPLWLEIEIWDCGWSVLKDEKDDIIGINYTYPYNNLNYDTEEEED